MSFAYLAALLVSIAGLATLDFRYRVAAFAQPLRTAVTVSAAVLFFLLWDLVGVGLGIFFIGDAPYLSGLVIAPEVPVEEVFFLILLTYQTLLLFLAFSRRGAVQKGQQIAQEEAREDVQRRPQRRTPRPGDTAQTGGAA